MRSRLSSLLLIALCTTAAALCFGCKPDFGARASRISEPRILAVKGTPAEARPGETVQYEALVALGEGGAPPAWATCASPKPATENNVVGASCLDADVHPFGEQSVQSSGTVPADACTLFGPDTPAPKPGQPPFRPHDPDVTGGYYLPVRVELPSADPAIGLERIRCNLTGAPPDVAQHFRDRYVPNVAPQLVSVVARVNGEKVDLNAIPAGAQVTLRADWYDSSAETYVLYDPQTESVVEKREGLRVSWYSTEGDFAADSTGRGDEETLTFSENTWTAPLTPGPVSLWVVLRDSRGGVDFTSLTAKVN